jgi:hypothetical protein
MALLKRHLHFRTFQFNLKHHKRLMLKFMVNKLATCLLQLK